MSFYKKIKLFVMKNSRANKLKQFCMCCKSGRVLDVGVTVDEYDNSMNYLLNSNSVDNYNYTGLGIDDLAGLAIKHPDKKFITYDGEIFPFKEKEFNCVYSNAVIEHVGNEKDQITFINEMCRVGGKVFFTTPNKLFPIESHTNTFLLHLISDKLFYKYCKYKKSGWDVGNLKLLSYGDLNNLLIKSNAEDFIVIRNKILGVTMTFSVICDS